MICWHKLYHFTVTNTVLPQHISGAVNRLFATVKWYNLCNRVQKSCKGESLPLSGFNPGPLDLKSDALRNELKGYPDSWVSKSSYISTCDILPLFDRTCPWDPLIDLCRRSEMFLPWPWIQVGRQCNRKHKSCKGGGSLPPSGFEPRTSGFKVWCSTERAKGISRQLSQYKRLYIYLWHLQNVCLQIIQNTNYVITILIRSA